MKVSMFSAFWVKRKAEFMEFSPFYSIQWQTSYDYQINNTLLNNILIENSLKKLALQFLQGLSWMSSLKLVV